MEKSVPPDADFRNPSCLKNKPDHSQVNTNTKGKKSAFNLVASAKPKIRPANTDFRQTSFPFDKKARQKAHKLKVQSAVIGTSKQAKWASKK